MQRGARGGGGGSLKAMAALPAARYTGAHRDELRTGVVQNDERPLLLAAEQNLHNIICAALPGLTLQQRSADGVARQPNRLAVQHSKRLPVVVAELAPDCSK